MDGVERPRSSWEMNPGVTFAAVASSRPLRPSRRRWLRTRSPRTAVVVGSSSDERTEFGAAAEAGRPGVLRRAIASRL